MVVTQQLLTVKEAAALLRVTERTIWRYIEHDRLPYIQIDTVIRIRIEDLLSPKLRSEHQGGERAASTTVPE